MKFLCSSYRAYFAIHILRPLIVKIEFYQHLKHALLIDSLKMAPWCRNM